MPAPDMFTTERLTARRVGPDDEPFLLAMWSDPAVTATLGGTRGREQVVAGLEAMIEHWERRGFGTWIVHDRTTGEPVGWVGLKETEVGGAGGVELLYAIAPARWRQGLASEAARAAVMAARDLGLGDLVCFTMVDNIGSQRTMAAAGFVGREEVEHAGLPHVLTRLDLARAEERRSERVRSVETGATRRGVVGRG